jgi:hypothetical protein
VDALRRDSGGKGKKLSDKDRVFRESLESLGIPVFALAQVLDFPIAGPNYATGRRFTGGPRLSLRPGSPDIGTPPLAASETRSATGP